MRTSQTWNKRTIVRTIIIVVGLGLVFGILFFIVRIGFRVKEIRFVADGMQMEINERLLATNIVFFPSQKVRADLLHLYPQFKDIHIIKKFPDTIEIVPVLRKPVMLIETGKTVYGVDEDGVVVDVGIIHTGIPIFTVEVPPLHVGTVIKEKQVLAGIAFYRLSRELFLVQSLAANPDGSGIRAKTDKTDILFSQHDDTSRVIATLQTIMAGVRIKGTMPVMIDIRFSKPVIQW